MRLIIKKWLPPVLVAGLSLGFGWYIFTRLILPAGQSNQWDEMAHALNGLLIAHDIGQGDWLNLTFDTYRMVFWPPLHPWLTGLAFLIAGAGIVTARSVSLIAFIIMAPTIYLSARLIRRDQGEAAGITAAVLLITSRPLNDYSALAMVEIPALLFLSLTILVYVWLNSRGESPGRYMLLGMAITLTYFLKMNYGIVLFMAVALTELIEAKFRPRLLFARPVLYTVLPMIVIFAIWFAYPPKILTTWQALINRPLGLQAPYGLEGWLYYPRALIDLCGSAWLLAVFLLAFMAAFLSWGNKSVRFLIILALIQFLLAESHHMKASRHLFPMLPCLFLLTGCVLAEGWSRWSRSLSPVLFWACRTATAILLLSVFILFLSSLHSPFPTRNNEVIEHVAAEVQKTGATLILGAMKSPHLEPPGLDWELAVTRKLLAVPQAGSITGYEDARQLKMILNRYRAPRRLIEILQPVISRPEENGKTRTVYLGFYPYYFKGEKGRLGGGTAQIFAEVPSTANETTDEKKMSIISEETASGQIAGSGRSETFRAEFDSFFQETFSRNSFDGVVVITSLTPFTAYPLDFLSPSLDKAGLIHISTRQFKDTALQVDVYHTRHLSIP